MKKILSITLCLVLLFTMIFNSFNVIANGNTTLYELQIKYPHGAYWNGQNADSYTWTPCTHHGSCSYSGSCGCNTFLGHAIQCMGFAYKLASLVYGGDPYVDWNANWNSSALDSLKAGDIVRYKNNGHSIFVTAVNGESVTYADCNSDGHCVIRWNQTISKSTLRSTFTYVDPAPYEWVNIDCSCSTSYSGNYTCTTSSANLTIRSGHGISYPSVGSIPPGATVYVSKASGTSSSDWAHVEYNGISGYASMQYLSKITNRKSVIHVWMSESEYGAAPSQYITKNKYWFCYEMYDENSGDNYNSYMDANYTITLSFYDPYGNVAFSDSVSNSDKNRIAHTVQYIGQYRCAIEITGDIVYNKELTFTVQSNGTVAFDKSSIELTIPDNINETLAISLDGNWPSGVGYIFEYDSNILSYEQDGSTINITAKNAGNTTFKMVIVDKNNNNAIITTASCDIFVGNATYTVSYDANGGTGAPSNQTKIYGITLTLSNIIPQRDGYVFEGWSNSSTSENVSYNPSSTYNCNDNLTLYAVWSKQHTCSYSPKVVKNATCTENGIIDYCCNCGNKYSESVSASGHDYDPVVTAPTCTERGFTTHACRSCDDSYVDSYTDKTGHTPGAEADCENAQVCTKCDAVLVKAKGHNYEGVVTKAAEVGVEGVKDYICTDCKDVDETKTETIPALPDDNWMLGDINGNNKIDMTDYILLKRAYFGTYKFSETQNKAGDINKNGKIDMTDYILLKRMYFGTYTVVLGEFVTDAYYYNYPDENHGDYEYSIPKINLQHQNISEINVDILNWCNEGISGYRTLSETIESIESGNTESLRKITYEWSVKGDILSLIIHKKCFEGNNYYRVYNVSINNGQTIDTKRLLDCVGVSEEKYITRVKDIVSSECYNYYVIDTYESIDEAVYYQKDNIAATMNDANVKSNIPFFNTDGDLCFVFNVYDFGGDFSREYIYNWNTHEIIPGEISIVNDILEHDIPQWKQLYLNYIEEHDISDYGNCSLVYIDDDAIPELFLQSYSTYPGDAFLWIYDGEINIKENISYGAQYFYEKQGLFRTERWASGCFTANIYKLENGELKLLHTGWFDNTDEDGWLYWDGKAVSSEEYGRLSNEAFDVDTATQVVNFERLELKTQILNWE